MKPEEYWAYEKAEFERHKHELEMSRPDTLRYLDALTGLYELVGNLFEHLDSAAEIECEREELKDRNAKLLKALEGSFDWIQTVGHDGADDGIADRVGRAIDEAKAPVGS